MGRRMIFTAVCLLLIIIIYKFSFSEKKSDMPMHKIIYRQMLLEGLETYSPGFVYSISQSKQVEEVEETIESRVEENVEKTYEEIEAEYINVVVEADDIYDKVIEENTVYEQKSAEFVPVQMPVAVYLEEQLQDTGFIKQTFYTEDPTTYIDNDQLSYEVLSGFDATLTQSNDQPQILIYHTHSQETYADSVIGDESDSIVGVGELLADILQRDYGYNVIHHKGQYDVESRDYAYSKALEGISTVLENNPSIEVIIDLHRDETNEDTKLVTTIQDKQMARFMFFNGLCYTRELGNLENLQNPYIQENLAFAFQMQLFADEYYPGITRRIYLKGYRYNMHFRPKSLLIELGSQTNTVEEAKNSCYPIAHIIASVLNGEN